MSIFDIRFLLQYVELYDINKSFKAKFYCLKEILISKNLNSKQISKNIKIKWLNNGKREKR